MGTIASVLQWTCTNCNLINPTENLKCLNCGNIRLIRFDRLSTDANDYDSSDSLDDSSETITKTTTSSECEQNGINVEQSIDKSTLPSTTTIKNHLHETLPGYVEINSNGYYKQQLLLFH